MAGLSGRGGVMCDGIFCSRMRSNRSFRTPRLSGPQADRSATRGLACLRGRPSAIPLKADRNIHGLRFGLVDLDEDKDSIAFGKLLLGGKRGAYATRKRGVLETEVDLQGTLGRSPVSCRHWPHAEEAPGFSSVCSREQASAGEAIRLRLLEFDHTNTDRSPDGEYSNSQALAEAPETHGDQVLEGFSH